MKELSIYSWFGFCLPLEERFRLIKKAGFTSTFIWWGDEFASVDGPKENHPELARKLGLQVENAHLSYYRANELWKDCLATEALVAEYKKAISSCSTHGIPTVVMHLTAGDDPSPLTGRGIDRMKRLVDLAESKAIQIALENVKHPEYLDAVFTEISSARLGFCYDSGHDYLHRPEGRSLLARYGNRLMALHLHDNDGAGDRHLIPGEGGIDWSLVKDDLNRVNYDGPIALEVTNEFSDYKDRETAAEFLRRAYEAARRLLDPSIV
jgi:sugar phosphate isomerase/epimerase